MFYVAKDGLKTNSNKLHNDIPTKKRYYKALKQLKDSGLIEKSSEYRGTYFHTTYGSIVYQKEIIEMTEYANNIEKIKTIDVLKKSGKYTEKVIQKLIQDVIVKDITTDDKSISNPSTSLPFTSEYITSYEELMSSLSKKIGECQSELLIATRLASEKMINEISLKAKVGVKVKILADTKLVQGYIKSQISSLESNNEKDNYGKFKTAYDNNESERIKVVENPWYPNPEGIDRKVCDIPFGIIVVDGNEAGVELINRNNSQNFFAGILIKDEKFATIIKDLFNKIWDSVPNNDGLSNSHNMTNNIVADTETKYPME